MNDVGETDANTHIYTNFLLKIGLVFTLKVSAVQHTV